MKLFLRDQSLDLKPSITTEEVHADSCNGLMWKAKVQMKYPEVFEIEGLASKKTEALHVCFLKACKILKEMGVLDQTNKPLLQKRKIDEQDLKSAKSDLLNLYLKICHRSGNKETSPKFNTRHFQGLYGMYWQSELHLSYPEEKVFEGSDLRSTTAEAIAAYEALLWLKSKGIISKKRRLLEYSATDAMKLIENHEAPYSICIPSSLQDKIQKVLTVIKKEKPHSLAENSIELEDPLENKSNEDNIMDLITERPYYRLTDQQKRDRSQYLYNRLCYRESIVQRDNKSTLASIAEAKSLLPISKQREKILKLIDENQVVVLSGETGSGKSTQVPQFIFDHYIRNMKGAECNIIATQPRRISAVSLAERIAAERGEVIGENIGYQIRLSKNLPHSKGAILFCTTGMLLRKILLNPNLEGISHVIIDEIHERSIQIDLILIILKNLLEKNKNIKILLMSATFNTVCFTKYFNTSASIHISHDKNYPVAVYELDSLVNNVPCFQNKKHGDDVVPILDVDLIVNTINYIDSNEPPGALLCFLPGWQEIRCVQTKLEKNENCKNLSICPVHSRLTPEEQKKIFKKPSDGQRKVILATNVAESSLTIDDVVYIVDSGLHKSTIMDHQAGIPSLCTQWITKANYRQRLGRAGRVRPGKYYKLFSKDAFRKMREYPIAEILRMPLESVILDCKLYCPDTKSEEFLSKAVEPPATSSIENGIKELQTLGVIDENENLTLLGNIAAQFSIHPRLSVALIYATFLGCFEQVLTICAILTAEREPFSNVLDDKFQMKKVKEMHDNGLCSDHLALAKILDTWNSKIGEAEKSQYIEENFLDDQTLQRIEQLKDLIRNEHNGIGLNYYSEIWRSGTFHVPSILAALTAAFFPNVIKIIQGGITNGKLCKDELIYSVIKGQRGYIQKESVASEAEELPSPWLIYFSALRSEPRQKNMVYAVSSIPGICFLLLAGKELTMTSMVKENRELAILQIDNFSKVKFSCTEAEARLLLDLRECLFETFNLFTENIKSNCKEREYLLFCYKQLSPVLKELLGTPQVPFTRGQMYEFVNNELIAKEL